MSHRPGARSATSGRERRYGQDDRIAAHLPILPNLGVRSESPWSDWPDQIRGPPAAITGVPEDQGLAEVGPSPIHHGTAAAVAVAETLEREPFMEHTGGRKLLLDRRASTPAPPTAPPPASPPRRGPRTGWRRASLSRGTSPLKHNRPPASAVRAADSLSASTWIIRVSTRTEPTYGQGSRP